MTTRSLSSARGAQATARLPLLEKGFRPFFLLGAAFAVLAVPLWIVALKGGLEPGGAFGAMQWHAHEMLFGFSCAIIAGFLLTAVGNWSGRETVTGWPLGALVGLWALGRAAVFFAARLPRLIPALLDVSFLPALAIACALPLFAARSLRNYGFVGLLFGLATANAAAHGYALHGDLESVRLAHHFALNLIVVLLVGMTGRVVPMFTRNATHLAWIRAIPLLERGSLAALILLALCDLVPRASPLSAAVSAVGAAFLLARMRFWGTQHTARQPLLWILHVGTLFIPLGLLLRVLAFAVPSVPLGSSLHALTAGAIGSLTLGMMARVSLGHTGRLLTPSRGVTWAFLSLVSAAVVRVGAPFFPGSWYFGALTVAAALWSSAFALFLFAYAKILFSARADAR
ncbi:MAG: NnrS family protein [Polyangiaceae bacterium]